jgi:hypothetical protein
MGFFDCNVRLLIFNVIVYTFCSINECSADQLIINEKTMCMDCWFSSKNHINFHHRVNSVLNKKDRCVTLSFALVNQTPSLRTLSSYLNTKASQLLHRVFFIKENNKAYLFQLLAYIYFCAICEWLITCKIRAIFVWLVSFWLAACKLYIYKLLVNMQSLDIGPICIIVILEREVYSAVAVGQGGLGPSVF